MKKALLSLLLVLLCLLPLAAIAEENDAIVYVNDLVKGNNEIEIRFLSTKNNAKTDATVLLCKGTDGLSVVVVDGGIANARCYGELVNLRKDLLKEYGLEKEQRNPQYKLRISLVVTHCHKDHVAELYTNILPAKMLAVEALYLPEKSTLPIDNTYDDTSNGDYGHRGKLLEAMAQYAGSTPVHIIGFRQTTEVPLAAGSMKLYGAESDFGTPDGLRYIQDTYYSGLPLAQIRSDIPTAVINSNSIWVRFTIGTTSALFTGDTMKKKSFLHNESFDRMIAFYGEELRSDIIKYPHHGISRNPAAVPLTDFLFQPNGIVVLTTAKARTNAGAELLVLRTPFVTTEDGDYTFVMTETGYEKTKGK